MSLSARERKTLESIEDGLTRDAPELVTLVSAFNRLTSDERMPDWERTPHGLRRFRVRLHYQLSRSQYRRFRRISLGLWLLITAVMIAVGALLGTSGAHRTCNQPMAMTCANPVTDRHPGTPAPSLTAPAP